MRAELADAEPAPREPIFREEALQATRSRWLGEIVVAWPLAFSVWALCAAFLTVAIVSFAVFGRYTRRTAVSGQLVPDTGLVKVYAAQPSVIVEKRVREGQHVRRADVLYTLSTERRSTKIGDTQASISDTVEERVHSLDDAIRKTQALEVSERAAFQKKLSDIGAELTVIEASQTSQRERVALCEQTVERYAPLAKQGYVSQDQLEQKQQDLYQQRAQLRELERSAFTLGRDQAEMEAQLRELAPTYANKMSDLARSMASARGELSESEAKRLTVATAPANGLATAVVGEVGQMIDPNKPLVAIVPDGSTLEAHLYAPSRAVGFIHPGSMVIVRLQSFPYQKFGYLRGHVIDVDRTALSSAELLGAGMTFPAASDSSTTTTTPNGETVYRVTVALPSQTIRAYGKDRHLESGMLVDATVMQESRRLSEWMLEPLFSISGKL